MNAPKYGIIHVSYKKEDLHIAFFQFH